VLQKKFLLNFSVKFLWTNQKKPTKLFGSQKKTCFLTKKVSQSTLQDLGGDEHRASRPGTRTEGGRGRRAGRKESAAARKKKEKQKKKKNEKKKIYFRYSSTTSLQNRPIR